MSNSITTGPFRAPALLQNGTPPTVLAIDLKNETASSKTVSVRVDRCAISSTPVAETTLFTQTVTLAARTCRSLTVTITPAAIYKVILTGDVDEDAEGIEAVVNGGGGGYHEPTMFFRHEDFVEVDD